MQKENIKDKIRILSLDGGGVRGYLTILMLEKIEKALNRINNTQKPIGEYFDLLVGTSTGAIIASGLAVGKSAKEIRILYENLMKEIFVPQFKGFVKPKYNSEILRKHLQKILGEKTFDEVDTHLCITSVDTASAKPKLFKSPYKEIYKQRSDELLIDAVMASAAAPIYFPLQKTKHTSYLADGGLVANNPSMIGLTEGYQLTNDLNKVFILSVGTGDIKQIPYDVEKLDKYGGILSWAMNQKNIGEIVGKLTKEIVFKVAKPEIVIPIIEILINTQSNLISFHLEKLLNEDNYLRLNPDLNQQVKLDEYKQIEILKNYASIADKEDVINKVNNIVS